MDKNEELKLNELAFYPYCGTLDRFKPRIQASDIPEAIRWFGRQPDVIALHPKNEALAATIAESIKVIFIGGCLSSEAWLSGGNSTVPEALPPVKEPVVLAEPLTPPEGKMVVRVKALKPEKVKRVPRMEKSTATKPPKRHQKPQNKKGGVSKLSKVSSKGGGSFETAKRHPGGRPRKTGAEISKTTVWRRRRELQGVLL